MNLALTLVVFAAARSCPEKYAFAPIYIFALDFPASYVAIGFRELLKFLLYDSYGSDSVLWDGIIFAAVGFTWYFVLGRAVITFLVWIRPLDRERPS